MSLFQNLKKHFSHMNEKRNTPSNKEIKTFIQHIQTVAEKENRLPLHARKEDIIFLSIDVDSEIGEIISKNYSNKKWNQLIHATIALVIDALNTHEPVDRHYDDAVIATHLYRLLDNL